MTATKLKEKLDARKKLTGKKVAEKGAKFETREQWLNAAVQALRVLFDEHGAADYPKLRVSCGFPKGGRGKTIGQAWHPDCSGDETVELFISPALEKLTGFGVVDTLLHELIHAVVGNECGHKGDFRKLAKDIGLSGKMTATFAEGELEDRLLLLVADLGPYPHAELTNKTTTKQSTRMIKVLCNDCGYTLRTTKKWIEVGLPTCVCGNEMEAPELS